MQTLIDFEANPSFSTAGPAMRDAVIHPQATFEGLPLKGVLLPGLIVALILGGLTWAEEVYSLRASVDSLLTIPQVQELVRTSSSPELTRILDRITSGDTWMGLWLLGLPTVPMGILATVVSLHLCLLPLGAGKGGLRETARVVAYSATGAALVMIPFVGTLLSLVIVSIQLVAGLGRVHETTTWRVIVALSLPMVLALVVVVAVAIGLVVSRV